MYFSSINLKKKILDEKSKIRKLRNLTGTPLTEDSNVRYFRVSLNFIFQAIFIIFILEKYLFVLVILNIF